MSLGGYKFAGHRCNKDSLTDLQWILRMHRCRIKSFLEASTFSSSNWTFDPSLTSGTYSFESSGNVIYSLDSLGYNLVSFFKHGSGDAYFAIMSSTYRGSSEDLANGKVFMILPTYGTQVLGVPNTLFCNISTVQLTPTNIKDRVLGSTYNRVNGKLLLNPDLTRSTSPSTWSTQYPYNYYDHFYSGFAVKGTNIICFVACDIVDNTNWINTSVFSVGGFSSLANPNDQGNYFCLNFQTYSANATSAEVTKNKSEVSSFGITAPNDYLWCDGDSTIYIDSDFFARYSGDMQAYPFGSICVTGLYNNEYKNYGKGYIAIDLIAHNACPNNMIPTSWYETAGNGNYLAVSCPTYRTYSGLLQGTTTGNLYSIIYCGWDASNPDITLEASWPVYTDA